MYDKHGCFVLLDDRSGTFQVMEKVSPASPFRLQTSSRLKKSFERVKAQVDVDLLHFRRDLVNLLGSATDEEGLSVLQRYQPVASNPFNL